MKQFDPESILNRMVQSLSSSTAWSEILIDGTNTRIFEPVTEAIAEIARYSEYNLSEGKWSIARNSSSLIKESKVLSYEPHRRIGARGSIRVSASETFDNPPSANTEIPKYTLFSGADLNFTSIATEQLTTVDNYIDIDVIQGTPRSIPTYVAAGDLNEEIFIDNANTDTFEKVLTVNDEEWALVNEIREYGPDDKVYIEENAIDFSGIYLKFGDGIHGKKLSVGDTINYTYIETEGSEGNILSLNIIDTVESIITDINTDVVELFVTNIEAIKGGDDYEELEDIRALAPKVFATGDRAVSNEDYETIIITDFLYVAKCKAWGAYETNIDAGLDPWTYIPTEDNVVHLACVTTSQENLTDNEKLAISRIIQPKKAPTDILQFEEVEFIYMIFNVDAFIRDRSFTLSQVKSTIFTTLQDNYSFDNLNFFESIYESDYISLIDNINGVDWHETYVAFTKTDQFETSATLPFSKSITLQLYQVSNSTVKVFIRDNTEGTPEFIQIAIDDGTGNFTLGGINPTTGSFATGFNNSLNITDITGSSITYSTGEIAIIINDGLTETSADYDIKIEYQLVSNNIILKERSQFLLFDSANIITSYT